MITSFELKNRPCCRFFYKIPYFIKNLFLIGCLAAVVLLNYLVHYQKSDLSIKSVRKWVAGLNSKTFNYLSQHDSTLFIGPSIKSVSVTKVKTVDFYSTCVSLSRPCMLTGLAKTWPAYNKWDYSKGGATYLSQLIQENLVSVYVEENPELSSEENFSGYSFDDGDVQRMKYSSEFLTEMSENPVGVVMRDMSGDISRQLELDIKKPDFYDNIAHLEGIQITQGQFFIDKTQYSRFDQFLCMVDGEATLRLVPHINRPEMYAGQSSRRYNRETHKVEVTEQKANESPVNLFSIDQIEYPNTEFLIKNYREDLAMGDCIFIPAFYFYKVRADAIVQEQKGGTKPSAIMVALQYQQNSALLAGFFDAIESGHLQ